MLVKEVSFYDFLREFEEFGRANNFSYEGKRALYDYLSELAEDLGEPMELDVIAICCDFTEYNSIEEFNNNYSHAIGEIKSIEDIDYYTIVIPINKDSFIIQDF